MYKYFEEKGIEFVPKVISFNEELGILIETSVGETHIKICNLENNLLDIFVEQLVNIHNLDYKEFLAFCKVNSFDVPQVTSPTESLERFGIKRFKRAKATCPDVEVINWIQPKLEKNIEIVKAIIHFDIPNINWGDIGGNTRTDGEKIWFIDFEYSSVGYGNELAYFKIHSHPTEEQFKYIVNKYSGYSKTDVNDVFEEIKSDELIIRVNDVIWAAMKWGENKSDDQLSKKYENLTFERMKLCEEMS